MHYLLGLMAMALAWLLPGHFHPYTAFQQDMLSMAGVVLLAVAGMMSLPRSSLVQVPVPAWFACGLALVPVAQWSVGLVPFEGALAGVSAHRCPSLLARELAQLAQEVQAHITQIKPGEVEAVMAQIAGRDQGHRVAALVVGQAFSVGAA